MKEEFERKRFHNAHEWRRFFFLWVSVALWLCFLCYMVGFHYFRESFEPIIMDHVGILEDKYYQYAEIQIFIFFIWSCGIVSALAIVNAWNKKRRNGDNLSDMFLVIIIGVTVAFAFYYAKVDLNYLNGQPSLLEALLN